MPDEKDKDMANFLTKVNNAAYSVYDKVSNAIGSDEAPVAEPPSTGDTGNFAKDHPVITGCVALGALGLLVWGISALVSKDGPTPGNTQTIGLLGLS